MVRCTPFLLFDGNCADAMKFYQKCLGGRRIIKKTGDTPMKDQFPAEKHDKIINARLQSAHIEISATDWHADNLSPKQGNMMSVYLVADKLIELKQIFNSLAEGADKDKRTYIELNQMPFGVYGQFTDKFGVPWIFVSQKSKSA